MLLNLIGRKFGSLVGKGLPWSVIGEVFLLSVPFLLAMTLPLAVLAATLYAFGQLANDSEITAMRAGGVSTIGHAAPGAGVGSRDGPGDLRLRGSGAAAEQRAAAQSLLRHRQEEAHLLHGRERHQQGALRPSISCARAASTPAQARLRSVSIYDVGQAERRRIIYADSGLMGYTTDGRDLVLKLFHGSVQQVTSADRPLFEHTTFSDAGNCLQGRLRPTGAERGSVGPRRTGNDDLRAHGSGGQLPPGNSAKRGPSAWN